MQALTVSPPKPLPPPPASPRPPLAAGAIALFAGNGALGNGTSAVGGAALDTALNSNQTLAVDAAGNVFLAQYYANVIFKIDVRGVITRFAGAGATACNGPNACFSGDGGPADQAKLFGPVGMTFDDAGALVFVDDQNARIRKVDAQGVITTVAGNGEKTFRDGLAPSASFHDPDDVVADGVGALYVTDYYNSRVRKVAAGRVSTIAGGGGDRNSGDGGPAAAASVATPTGIALGLDGALYVSSLHHHVVRRIKDGVISTFAGTGQPGFGGDGGPASAARIKNPNGLAVDRDGNVYVAEMGDELVFADASNGGDRVRRIDRNGVITTVAGDGADAYDDGGGRALAASFQAHGIAIDRWNNLFIADPFHRRVLRVQL
ncbi:MAG: SBBP repeat-containing protein [Acidimicrobiales bacterium]